MHKNKTAIISKLILIILLSICNKLKDEYVYRYKVLIFEMLCILELNCYYFHWIFDTTFSWFVKKNIPAHIIATSCTKWVQNHNLWESLTKWETITFIMECCHETHWLHHLLMVFVAKYRIICPKLWANHVAKSNPKFNAGAEKICDRNSGSIFSAALKWCHVITLYPF